MNDLERYIVPKLRIKGLRFVRDLEFFDGPLLTEFKSRKQESYLKYWCDCNEEVNRWMLFRVGKPDIVRLAGRFAPLSYIIPNRILDDSVYLFDQDSNRKLKRVYQLDIEEIPDDYMPSADSYLSSTIDNKEDFPVLIERSTDNIHLLPNRLRQISAFLHVISKLPEATWPGYLTGAFNSHNFFQAVQNMLPGPERIRITAFQYSSPGFFNIKMNAETAERTTSILEEFKRDFKGHVYRLNKLSRFISDNGLVEKAKREDSVQQLKPFNEKLGSLTEELLRPLGEDILASITENTERPINAAQLAKILTVRIRKLIDQSDDGNVIYPAN